MKIQSNLLGEIDIDPQLLIHFPGGIPAFEQEQQFVLMPMDPGGPFYYLQSACNSGLCLLIAEPFAFFPDYEIEIPDQDLEKLGVEPGQHQVAIYVVLTIPEDFRLTTANLLAPIIINPENRQAMQFIATKTGYTTRHPIFRPQRPAAGAAVAAVGEGR